MNIEQNRFYYNKIILDKIKEIVEKYPFMRFGQILVNLDIVHVDGNGYAIDPFYEESEVTWNKINRICCTK